MKVICINDQNKPAEVPSSKWIKKGNKYTIIKVEKMLMMPGTFGVELEEIDLSDCFPHTRFNSNRFKIVDPVDNLIEKLENMLEEVH
tara:strand:+ start:201 stop:461 length:261 start_codon:yes stop_codon:yes gene_type:complete